MTASKDADDEANAQSNDTPTDEKEHGSTRRYMSEFIAFLFGTFVFVVTFAFVVGHLVKGTYEGYMHAMYWGIPAFIAAGIAIFAGFYTCVVIPSKKAGVPPANRPWLSLEEVRATGPLIFRDGGVDLPVTFKIKNTGDSPAHNVTIKISAFFPTVKEALSGGILRKQREVCEAKRIENGETFFKNDSKTISVHLVMNRQEIEAQIADAKEALEKLKLDARAITPHLVGCIAYRFGKSWQGRTGFSYSVSVGDGRTAYEPWMSLTVPSNSTATIPTHNLPESLYLDE